MIKWLFILIATVLLAGCTVYVGDSSDRHRHEDARLARYQHDDRHYGHDHPPDYRDSPWSEERRYRDRRFDRDDRRRGHYARGEGRGRLVIRGGRSRGCYEEGRCRRRRD